MPCSAATWGLLPPLWTFVAYSKWTLTWHVPTSLLTALLQAQGWEIALGIIGVVIGGTAYATSISCSIFSTANKNYCPNKCTEFNAKYLPYLPKGPNVGGKCVGGKCECTIFGTELPKCTVQKWGSNGNRVQWLTYPGRCARYSFQCPSNSRIASMGTTGVSGCPKGQVCCH